MLVNFDKLLARLHDIFAKFCDIPDILHPIIALHSAAFCPICELKLDIGQHALRRHHVKQLFLLLQLFHGLRLDFEIC